MDKTGLIRQLIGGIDKLKQTQGTAAFNPALVNLYRIAAMAAPHIALDEKTDAEVRKLMGEIGVSKYVTRACNSPVLNYCEHALQDVEASAAESYGCSVEDLRTAGM